MIFIINSTTAVRCLLRHNGPSIVPLISPSGSLLLIISPTIDSSVYSTCTSPSRPHKDPHSKLLVNIFFFLCVTRGTRNSCMNIYVIVTLDCEFKMQNSQFAFVKSSPTDRRRASSSSFLPVPTRKTRAGRPLAPPPFDANPNLHAL